jgi:hypothetical protein
MPYAKNQAACEALLW